MIGDIYIFNNREKDWFSSAQRFFTRMPFTHAAIDVGDVLHVECLFEADYKTTVTPKAHYQGGKIDFHVYRPKMEADKVAFVAEVIYRHFAKRTYGFSQVLYFVYRWFWESLGRDVRRKKNPFPNGDICSELVYVYMTLLVPNCNKEQAAPLQAKLGEWRRDTFHAGDIYTVCRSLPDVFELIEVHKGQP